MCTGQLISINIAEQNGAPTRSVAQILARPGRGLVGDRHYGANSIPERNLVSLIEIEAITALRREHGIDLAPADARRNLVTQGIPLNHLVDAEFQIGEVRLRGVRLCEPCKHLENLTQPGVLAGLIHRGGLLAAITNEGVIRAGDAIQVL